MSTGVSNKKSLIRSVTTVSGATAFSRVLGLVREQVMAYYFGASLATDAFVTAFRIPNLLRDMFAEGALSSAFVPVFKEKLVQDRKEEAFSLANITISAVLVIVGLLVLLGIIAAPIIIYLTANGFTADPLKFAMTVSLTRIMFVYLLLVSLSAVVMGMLNSFGRFAIPALAPAMFNVGMIISVWGLHSVLDVPVYALAIGVLIGGVGQLVVQLPALFKLGFRFRFNFDFLNEGFKRIVRLFGPMVVGLSASRINIVISTLLASFLIEGTISYLNYSYRLMHFPLGVFAVALGTVSLPKASELAAKGDMKEMANSFNQAISLNLVLILPSAAFLAIFARDIVSLIYQYGSFSDTDSSRTALALLHYSYGLIGFAAVRVTAPFYYAMGDSTQPTRFSLITVGANLLLYYPAIMMLDFAGLAAATSIAGLINFGLLLYFLPGKGIPVSRNHILLIALRIAVAAAIAFLMAAMIPVPSFLPDSGISGGISRLIISALSGALLFFLLCYIFRVKELSFLYKGFLKRVR